MHSPDNHRLGPDAAQHDHHGGFMKEMIIIIVILMQMAMAIQDDDYGDKDYDDDDDVDNDDANDDDDEAASTYCLLCLPECLLWQGGNTTGMQEGGCLLPTKQTNKCCS